MGAVEDVGSSVWAVMAEIDKAEVIQGAATERPALAGVLLFFYGYVLSRCLMVSTDQAYSRCFYFRIS